MVKANSQTKAKLGFEHMPIEFIPEGWRTMQLQKVAKTFSGGTPSRLKPEYFQGDIPWIKSSELNQEYITTSDEFISEDGIRNSAAKLVEKGTLLLALYGATAGVSAITGIKTAINQAVLAIIPNEKIAYNAFLNNWFRLNRDKIIFTFCQGGQPNLSSKIINSLEIQFPPLIEQKAIVDVLDSIDKVIQGHRRLMLCRKHRKVWLMQQLLTGKKRLEGYTSAWQQYKISDLFQLEDRYVNFNDAELYKLVSIRRRFGGLFFRGDLRGEQISVKCLKEIHAGDFLISKRQAAHGAWAVVPKKFQGGKVSDEYECLTIKDPNKLSSPFWGWYCQQPIMRHYAFLDANGVHIEKLIFDYDQFKKRKVKLPPTIEEQTAIAHLLQTADKEISLFKQKIEKLKQQKKGLMQVLLTGKKRLKF